MWYREAAFGTIDLQKYTSEKLGEDFDFQKELMSLLQSGITGDGFVIFDVLNNNLPKSKLKEYISFFWRSKNPEALASYNRRTKEVQLNHLKPGQTIDDLALTLRHELRHAVDKGHDYRPKWISNFEVSLTASFFYKFKNIILDFETNEIKYDQDKLIFMMVYNLLRASVANFDNLSEDEQNFKIQDAISKNIKRPDQILEVIKRLADGESKKDISAHYYINNPQEYTTLLSDIDELFSPQAFMSYANQFSFMEKEKLVDAIRFALTKMSDPSVYAVLRDISSEGANLLVHILMFAKNEQMQRNVYRIVNDNFQKFLDEFTKEPAEIKEPDQFKEANKKYKITRQ